MGRPTKEAKLKREKIINLGLHKRDNLLYTDFEERTEKLSKAITSHIFCGECHKRIVDSTIFSPKKDEKFIFRKKYKSLEDKFYSLLDIDKDIFYYYYYIHQSDNNSFLDDDSHKFYTIENIELELDEVEKFKRPSNIILINKNYSSFNPLRIHDTPMNLEDDNNSPKVNKVYAELDLSKPIEELLEFVSMIKKEYKQNPKNIYSHDFKAYECTFSNCDIYKSKSPKPMNGRLSDVLFIYDCKKANLNNEYIIDEINNYWQDNKKIYKDTFRPSTLETYYDLSKKYIDNKEYKAFTCGYDLS